VRRFLFRLAWLLANLRWLAGRGPRTRYHGTPLKGVPACEACGVREGTVLVPSKLQPTGVYLCEWCHRRWRRANQLLAVPKSRRPKNGGGNGRAA
jgi:hypothetical protein